MLRAELDLEAEPRIHPLIRGSLCMCVLQSGLETSKPRIDVSMLRTQISASGEADCGKTREFFFFFSTFVEHRSLLLLKSRTWAGCPFEVVW